MSLQVVSSTSKVTQTDVGSAFLRAIGEAHSAAGAARASQCIQMGPPAPCLRTLVQSTMAGRVVGTRVHNSGVCGPFGRSFDYGSDDASFGSGDGLLPGRLPAAARQARTELPKIRP